MFIVLDNSTIIVDVGTETFKIGYSDKDIPSLFNSSKTFSNNFISPVKKSVVDNLESYTNLLTANLPEDTSYLLICENTFENEETKNSILTHVMEENLASSLLFSKSAILDSFSYGKSTSIVISLSGGSTQIVSIVDGYITYRKKIDYGGLDVSMKFLEKLDKLKIQNKFSGCLTENENFLAFKKLEYARFKKEDFVSKSTENTIHQFYYLFDKIFEIVDHLDDLLQSNSPDLQNTLLNNILISGGGSFISDIICLLEKYISKKWTNLKFDIKNNASNFHTFFGGAIMGNIGNFKSLNVGKSDYLECGINILKRKNQSWILNKEN